MEMECNLQVVTRDLKKMILHDCSDHDLFSLCNPGCSKLTLCMGY